MAMDDAKFAELLREAGLGEYTEAILRYKQPCIRLHTRPVDDPASLPLGTSHIGGLPDLPPGVQWPTRNGRPCEFIAQINLTDASPYDPTGLLSKEGTLLFFYDGREHEDAHYEDFQKGSETIRYYTGEVAALERVDFPEALQDWQRYRMCSITFETDWMLPNSWTSTSHIIEKEVFGHTRSGDLLPPQIKAYGQVTTKLEPAKYQDKHHMLGYSEPVIQDDPLYSVPGAWDGHKTDYGLMAEWMLLFQISSDYGIGMGFGDDGSLYYCIRRDDLIARQFDNAACVMQSY